MKRILLGLILISVFLFALHAAATEAVVYLDGTGATEGAYTDFKTAVSALTGGGTLIVTGDTTIGTSSAGVTLSAVGGKVTVTGQNGAVLTMARSLTLASEFEFNNITFASAHETIGNLFCGGNDLTIGENVVTVPSAGGRYPCIFGGKASGTCTGNVHVTIQSGVWHGIFGGNYAGAFTGNTALDVTGGTVKAVLCGGNRNDNFTGNTTLYIGGSAVVEYNKYTDLNITSGDYMGIIGGSMGISGGSARTFNGNITLTIGGSADVFCNVLGTSRYTNIATTADVTVTVTENATLRRHLYGAGYGNYTARENGVALNISGDAKFINPSGSSGFICAGANSGSVTGNLVTRISGNAQIAGNVYGGGFSGTLSGNSTVVMSGGSVGVTLSAGSRTGTVNGDARIEMTGGRLTNASYGAALGGGYVSSTSYGSVSGKSSALLDGASVAGSISGAERAGSYEITLKSGNLGSTAHTVETVDLTGGKTLSVGGTVSANTLIGGGTLTLSGALTASAASGEVTLSVAGTPQNGFTYVTVNDPESTLTVNYAPADDETLIRTVTGSALTYTVSYPERYDTTHIRINYYNPHGPEEIQPKLVVSSSTPSDPDRVAVTLTKGVQDGIPYAEADLAPGHYYYKAYYGNGGSDYELHYFVVSGKEESHTYNIPFEPYVADSYMETMTAQTTEEIMAAFFNNADLTGFETSPTPTFTRHTDEYRAFMSNEEMLAYIDTLSAPYLYKFSFAMNTEYDNQMPVLVFTKDEIPAGATIEEIAAIVRSGGVREIWQIDGGIHGNEPTGPEAALWFAAELCGDYGANLLDRFGAIVIIPDACPDNSERFMREYADGVNSNRDLVSLSHIAAQKQAYIVDLFMPTVFVDLHEDGANEPIILADYSVDSIVDIRFDISCLPNSGVGGVNGLIDGTSPLQTHRDYQTVQTLIAEVAARSGLRTAGYHPIQYNPGVSTSYAKARGAYAFLFETMRLWTGKQRYARSVFAEKTALMTLGDIIYDADGAFAAEVALGRANTAVTVYDEHNYFATAMTSGGSSTYTLISPSAYLNGKIKDAAHTDTFKEYDTVTAYRPMPTGYVLPADTENIAQILALCDLHGLEYLRLRSGSTLTLRRYTTMSNTAAALGEAAEVTFADGAYLFLTDNEDAYLVAYLFEPDSFKTSDTKVSLLQMELLSESDALYRSQTDYLRAAVSSMLVPADAEDFAVIADGEIFTALSARADGIVFAVFQAAPDLPDDRTAALAKPAFTVNYVYEIRGDYILPVAFESAGDTVAFAAEAGKVYACAQTPLLTYGDANGDGNVSLADALRILRALADNTVTLDRAAADIDHTASVGLLDVLSTLRTLLN